jgi:2-desacetyl-2-hydroxyethyl bacteriochlorophyllide A dehydrogenase
MMLAALLTEPGAITLDEVADPDIGPADVRIEVGGVGLCGSDLSVYSGKWAPPRYPWIMGHEAFGRIEATGSDVDASRVGEVVVIEPNVACGACGPCDRGRTSACENRQSVGMNRPGALAHKVVVPQSRAWPMQSREPRDLVCVEPLTVVETALRRLPGELPGEALVVGAGAQGLFMTLALRRRGVRVHVADVNEARVAFAVSTLGALAITDDEQRFPFIVDTAGVPDSMAEAVRRSEVGATILELGLDARPFGLDAETLVRRQLVLRGSLTYDHPDDFRWSTSLVSAGTVAPGVVVAQEFPLAEAQAAFEASRDAPGKTWIRISDVL